MTTSTTLTEWRLARDLNLSSNAVTVLQERFKASVTPAVGGRDGELRWDVRPGNVIGVVQAGSDVVVVRPKVRIRNLMFLLAFVADPDHWQEAVDLDDDNSLTEAIAALFVRLASDATARGLLRGYREHADALLTVRGRIDFAEMLRRRPGVWLPLEVTFQEHDASILENQILQAAVEVLGVLPIVRRDTVRGLQRLRALLTEVEPRAFPADPPAVMWTRLNRHYRAAVELGRLILTGSAVDLRRGAHPAAGITIDMAVVFETFVREALRRALGLTPAQFPDGDGEPPVHLDERRLVRLKPDLRWWDGDSIRFVGDAKYKIDERGIGQDRDIYQLHAYATAHDLPESTLIYANGPERTTLRVVHDGPAIHIEHLDLSREPLEILGQIDRLARAIKNTVAGTRLDIRESAASMLTVEHR